MNDKDRILEYIALFPYSESYSQPPALFDNIPNRPLSNLTSKHEPLDRLAESFLYDRFMLHQKNLDALRYLLSRRMEIYTENIRQIGLRIGETRNHLMQMLQFPGIDSSTMLQRRTELDKLIAGLYQQQNGERTNLWRDLRQLREEMMTGAKYYQTIKNALNA